ncbi:UdgX family uracil-DNA binding protein [Agrobacterium tumefaciens]|uniref:UdgX family uracil-DNA binding protein n=1 Tax=Agrobacterium tumefaciens TaxID=358 RepID=UPI00045AABF0|nr:UdgX family uracil-DNA binding protein [Agrobacterium tumefaciens]CDN92484.1 DNA polymerase bacteriophage-type [Agrobacterium tumefaciens]
MYSTVLEGRGDFSEWRDAARAALAADIPPDMVDWQLRNDGAGLFDFAGEALPVPGARGAQVSVPASFVALAQAIICHSDPGRFALLYRLLWRLKRDRALLQFKSDPDVSEVRLLEKSVRRDCHKMTAFVRFKELPLPQGQGGRRRFVAWFEPDHFIVERTAPFFQRRFTDMDWLIATPNGSAQWDGDVLRTSRQALPKPELTDETDELWRTYYANIFNPARLKIKAMTGEMPKKYWKNLPEADLIPGLVLGAEARVLEMAAKAATQPQPFHHRLQAAASAREMPQPVPDGTLASLAREASQCTRCALHCKATQTVFGMGPEDAKVMIVGEQPGDHEDLAGKPFVGPAGQLLDRVLAEADIDRKKLYVTNAVKHFKYETRGKRRIHQRPNAGEVEQCRWWLNREIALVRPKLIVAMGATALYALTGGKEKISEIRGRPIPMQEGRTLFITVHPSYLLRLPDAQEKEREMLMFKKEIEFISLFE